VKIVAPKDRRRAKLADGSMLAADGQLAGTPSVLFDASPLSFRRGGQRRWPEGRRRR
jgi:hypothetical protein